MDEILSMHRISEVLFTRWLSFSVSMPINYNFLCEIQIRVQWDFLPRFRAQSYNPLSTSVYKIREFSHDALIIPGSKFIHQYMSSNAWIRADRTAVDNSRVFTLASFALRSIALSTAAGFEFKVIVASRLVLTKPSVFIVLRSFQRACRNYIFSTDHVPDNV